MNDGSPAEPRPEWFAAGTIERRKLENYLLSPHHPQGKHKARLWRSVFGFEQSDGSLLEHLIRTQLAQAEPVEKPGGKVRRLGARYSTLPRA